MLQKFTVAASSLKCRSPVFIHKCKAYRLCIIYTAVVLQMMVGCTYQSEYTSSAFVLTAIITCESVEVQMLSQAGPFHNSPALM